MNEHATRLHERLEAIGSSLAGTDHALALIGLGSVGTELDRLDPYSDLDFFAIVADDYKTSFIRDLTWLSDVAPIAFSFQNTRDGHKVFFRDGIYAEFAVFGQTELKSIPIEGGRIIWQAPGTTLSNAQSSALIPQVEDRTEWLLGEILTNLYVGLTRLCRGETLSAERLIQEHAINRLLELTPHIEQLSAGHTDVFDPARRFETRFPGTAEHLPNFIQGYGRTAESAVAILDFLDGLFPVNDFIQQQIRDTARIALTQTQA